MSLNCNLFDMGIKSYEFLKNNYSVEKIYKIIKNNYLN